MIFSSRLYNACAMINQFFLIKNVDLQVLYSLRYKCIPSQNVYLRPPAYNELGQQTNQIFQIRKQNRCGTRPTRVGGVDLLCLNLFMSKIFFANAKSTKYLKYVEFFSSSDLELFFKSMHYSCE